MKTVSILRGISGSGKSTLAATLATPGAICSADNFFLDKFGKYAFNSALLTDAHRYCLNRFLDLVASGAEHLVVDNTNLRHWEFELYEKIARLAGYAVEFHEHVPPSDPVELAAYLKLCAGRNKHGLNLAALTRQAAAFEART